MVPALHRVLNEENLGLVLVARAGEGQAVVGYSVATFGYDLEIRGPRCFRDGALRETRGAAARARAKAPGSDA